MAILVSAKAAKRSGLTQALGPYMKYLETAFGQLAFAWKLYNYGLDGKIDLAALDIPLRFE